MYITISMLLTIIAGILIGCSIADIKRIVYNVSYPRVLTLKLVIGLILIIAAFVIYSKAP